MQITDRAADAALATTVALPTTAAIALVNEYLQAAAFIVAIVSGISATVYYIRKARSKR